MIKILLFSMRHVMGPAKHSQTEFTSTMSYYIVPPHSQEAPGMVEQNWHGCHRRPFEEYGVALS